MLFSWRRSLKRQGRTHIKDSTRKTKNLVGLLSNKNKIMCLAMLHGMGRERIERGFREC
jgi:hypothetical protein